MKDLWVFDNDGTLYDDSEVQVNFMEIFSEYVASFLGVSDQEVPTQLTKLKGKWDTEFSIIALMKEFRVDYFEVVNNTYLKVDFGKCGVPRSDPIRKKALDGLSGKKIVFTNNPSVFARRVLAHVGLESCFSDFVGMEEICFVGKSDIRAFQTIEARHQGFSRIVLCDDSLRNLELARQMGWTTVWFKRKATEMQAGQEHIEIMSFDELQDVLKLLKS